MISGINQQEKKGEVTRTENNQNSNDNMNQPPNSKRKNTTDEKQTNEN